MMGNGKIFISHAHEDNLRCDALLAALTGMAADYWFDTERMDAGQNLTPQIQNAIAERDIFIRVCSAVSQKSFWVMLETGAFRGLQAQDYKDGKIDQRVLINFIVDTNYMREPFDNAAIFIDATNTSPKEWSSELRRAILGGQSPSPPAIPATPHYGASMSYNASVAIPQITSNMRPSLDTQPWNRFILWAVPKRIRHTTAFPWMVGLSQLSVTFLLIGLVLLLTAIPFQGKDTPTPVFIATIPGSLDFILSIAAWILALKHTRQNGYRGAFWTLLILTVLLMGSFFGTPLLGIPTWIYSLGISNYWSGKTVK